jgi:hypothetical protein
LSTATAKKCSLVNAHVCRFGDFRTYVTHLLVASNFEDVMLINIFISSYKWAILFSFIANLMPKTGYNMNHKTASSLTLWARHIYIARGREFRLIEKHSFHNKKNFFHALSFVTIFFSFQSSYAAFCCWRHTPNKIHSTSSFHF